MPIDPGGSAGPGSSEGVTPSPGRREPESVIAQFQISAEFSTPFPPPEFLRRYKEILPEAPERILSMIEAESKHRRSLESKHLQAQIDYQIAQRSERRLGQWLGFFIGTIAILAGAITSIFGNPVAGGFIGTGGVVGLVAVFVLGRYMESRSERPAAS
jgi:uncharacterized membrane protein